MEAEQQGLDLCSNVGCWCHSGSLTYAYTMPGPQARFPHTVGTGSPVPATPTFFSFFKEMKISSPCFPPPTPEIPMGFSDSPDKGTSHLQGEQPRPQGAVWEWQRGRVERAAGPAEQVHCRCTPAVLLQGPGRLSSPEQAPLSWTGGEEHAYLNVQRSCEGPAA